MCEIHILMMVPYENTENLLCGISESRDDRAGRGLSSLFQVSQTWFLKFLKMKPDVFPQRGVVIFTLGNHSVIQGIEGPEKSCGRETHFHLV